MYVALLGNKSVAKGGSGKVYYSKPNEEFLHTVLIIDVLEFLVIAYLLLIALPLGLPI